MTVSGKECSCKCRKYSYSERTLGEAKKIVSDKEHLKSIVPEGAISHTAND